MRALLILFAMVVFSSSAWSACTKSGAKDVVNKRFTTGKCWATRVSSKNHSYVWRTYYYHVYFQCSEGGREQALKVWNQRDTGKCVVGVFH